MNNMQNADREALEAFVLDSDLASLEKELARFNIFEAVGMISQETRHSHFLAFLLNPSGNHGLGEAFLKQLLIRSVRTNTSNTSFSADHHLNVIDIDGADLHEATVQTEWNNIDIFIVNEKFQLVVVIENKIFSREHDDQLRRYREILEENYPEKENYRHLLIFLTPNEDTASHREYVNLGYKAVAEVIDDLRRTYQSTLGSEVSTLMEHYTIMLRRHIVDGGEIPELSRKIWHNHKQALEILMRNRPDLRPQIADYLQKLILSEPQLVLDECKLEAVRFAPLEWDNILLLKQKGWTKHNRMLLFQFDNTVKSLTLTLYIGKGPEQVRKILLEVAQSKIEYFKKISIYRSSWKDIYTTEILRGNELEDVSFDDVKPKIEQAWREFLATDLLPIIDTISSINWSSIETE